VTGRRGNGEHADPVLARLLDTGALRITRETGLAEDLFRVDLSAVVSKYIGETEKNLRTLFDAAEQGGAILLLDEGDALFGTRAEGKAAHDRHAEVEVSYLLERIGSFGGIVLLTSSADADPDD